MKKITALLLALAAAAALAETITSGTAIEVDDCAYLSENVTPQLSNNVVGAYACTATAATVATAAVKGKGFTYASSTDGGKIQEDGGDAPFASEDAAQAAAESASGSTPASGS